MIVASTFTGVWDRAPSPSVFANWCEFADYLEAEAEKPAKPDKWTKERTLCVCPGIYEEGASRAKANVLLWNWWAVDIDNKGGNRPGASMLETVEKMEGQNCPFVIYTTTNHRGGADCYRLMFPISRPVGSDEFPQAWLSIAEFLGCADPQTKDESRLFIAPRKWSTDSLFIRWDEGEPLDVDIVMFNHPPQTSARLFAHRRAASFANISHLPPVPLGSASLSGPFVKPEALSKATTGGEGGRMFGLLMSAASVALHKGYAITAQDLIQIGRELAMRLGRSTSDIAHDAQNALDLAIRRFSETKATRFEKATSYTAPWIIRRNSA